MNQKHENIFVNICCNIVIPILILNKGHHFFTHQPAVWSLLSALLFPIGYGLFDLLKNKKKNIISIFGVLNVLFTGGLALFKVKGIWFAVKEAGFPLLIAVFVFISAYTKKSFFKYITQQSQLFNWEAIHAVASEQQLNKLFRQSTIIFSLSFLLSAVMNFILAIYIFTELDSSLPEVQKEIILNKQIADMTWMGFVVIGLPLTLFSAGILWYFIKELSKISQLPKSQLIKGWEQTQE